MVVAPFELELIVLQGYGTDHDQEDKKLHKFFSTCD